MKKSIIIAIIGIFLFSCTTQKQVADKSQSNQKQTSSLYYKKMSEMLPQMGQAKTPQDFNKLSNQFVVIANAEKEEWLPLYYAAQCKIIASFMVEDPTVKDMYLEQTKGWFEQMEKMAPDESEIAALKALYYTAALVVNPMARGQEYSILSNKEAMKALSFDKDNPRAKYILLANKIGFAKFFGKPIDEECAEAKALLEDWDSYQPKSPIHPKWGKDRVAEIVKECGK